mmetsp:Transcript_19847/g.42589  ORF Transcript_19847/g.42589 Transcript_19847/m.42589 type:complete len:282 (+) Transcript_19847:112-957(+)
MNPQAQGSTNRPVVVLAGWLGCQPRHLRRYRQMYDCIGWDSLVRIGSPRSVVAAMTEGPSGQPSQSEMQHFAIHTLQELQKSQPPYFIIHMFSNNGCFLWEWIRLLLFGEHSSLSTYSYIDVHKLGQRLVGIIFDSAPAYYHGEMNYIQSALEYVPSTTERCRLLEITKSLKVKTVKQRFGDFWSGLRDNSADVPQLYLYSECDKLAAVDQLEKFLLFRERILGKENVWKHNFLDSDHCCHLLKYPEEYGRIVKQFLSFCITKSCGMCNHSENDFSVRSKL